jgi:agmatinase
MSLEDARTEVDVAFARDGLRGAAFENAFGGAVSFLRRRYTKDLAGWNSPSRACPSTRR